MKQKIKNQLTVCNLFILFNIIFYVYLALKSNNFININSNLLKQFGLNKTAIYSNFELYRIVTGNFTQANLIHLILNVYFIHQFGNLIEKKFGMGLFTLLYISSMFVIGIATYFNGSGYSVGASGILCALLAFQLEAFIGNLKSLVILVAFNFALNLFFPVNNYLHLIGVVYGCLFYLILIHLKKLSFKENNVGKLA